MNDRMSVSARAAWRDDKPAIGAVVEVYYRHSAILATWNGTIWRTVDGAELPGVTHWRTRR